MIPVNKDSGNETYPMVSVIIPVKNEAKRIVACLESLIAVNYPKDRYEVILVDNGSTDGTAQMALNYGVRVIACHDQMISGSRNMGANLANGSLLAFVDADVTVSKDWLSSAIECLNQNLGAGCVGSFPLPPDESGWVTKLWWFLQIPKSFKSDEEVNWLPSMNMVVKKEAYELVKGFNPDLVTCEDVDFCYRLGAKYKIVYCKDMVAIHYGEPKSLRELFKKERWRGTSNYDGLRAHGLRIDELPSLLLPLYYWIIAIWFLLAIVALKWESLIVNLFCWVVPPLLKSYLSAKKVSNYKFLHKMTICYFVYSIARTFAAIDWIRGKLSHLIIKKG